MRAWILIALALAGAVATVTSTADAAARNGLLLVSSCASTPDGDARRLSTMTTHGSGLRLLHAFPSEPFPAECGDYEFSWSPDGRSIAFRSGNLLSVTDARLRHAHVVGRHLFGTAWSPDGRRLAVVLFREPQSYALAIVARANGRVHRITPWTPDGLTVTSWRSDGRSIAFVRYVHHDPNPSRVWTVGADGRHARFVTYGDYPQWSPDRRWLAYRQPRDTSNNLEMVRPNGTGRHQVTHHRGTFFVGHFSWSPDGRSIAYPFRSPDLRAPQVRIVSASGKLRSRIELPAKVGQATDVDWQPQNRR